MEKHQKKPLRQETDIKKNDHKSIIEGSGQEDQLEKFKHGQKIVKDDSGGKPNKAYTTGQR